MADPSATLTDILLGDLFGVLEGGEQQDLLRATISLSYFLDSVLVMDLS